jgi:hypothetical protein
VNYKKIIAREFLFALSVLFTGISTFLGVYAYNAFQKSEVKRMTSEITIATAKSDSLSLSLKEKMKNREWFFDEWSKYFDLTADGKYSSITQLWKRSEFLAQHDSIQYRWANVWTTDMVSFFEGIGFSNSLEFEDFIERNLISKADSINSVSSDSLTNLVKNIEAEKSVVSGKIISSDDQLNLVSWVVLIAAIVIFGIRFIIYGVLWSLKVLKT